MDQELSSMLKMENGKWRREQIMRDRASKRTIKVGRSQAAYCQGLLMFAVLRCARYARRRNPIHSTSIIWNLSHTVPNSSSTPSLLQRLSTERAISHIMLIHQFSVGLRTELAPLGHPELDGHNINAGEAITVDRNDSRHDFYHDLEGDRKDEVFESQG